MSTRLPNRLRRLGLATACAVGALAFGAAMSLARAADPGLVRVVLDAREIAAASARELAGKSMVPAPTGAWLARSTRGSGTITVFFYGSYMSRPFVAQRLSAAAAGSLRPAVAYGAMRVFDFVVPPAAAPAVAVEGTPRGARGGPTLELTGRPGDVVNGVLIDLTTADVPRIAGADNVFDLVPVLVSTWPRSAGERARAVGVYAFVAPRALRDPGLEPHAQFWCQMDQAAAAFGAEFHRMWRESTWRAGLARRVADAPPACE